MILLAMSLAFALDQPRIIDGSPEFAGCLDEGSACQDSFYRFLGESMLEQGYTFQNDSQLLSAVLSRRDGLTVGGNLTTFPLSPPRENLSGKEEKTDYSPVLPRVFVGYTVSSEKLHYGGGLSLLPPIPVGGASAFVFGAEAAVGYDLGPLRVGPELDFSLTRARAPIVASEEQYESRNDFDNANNLRPETYEAVCVPAGGCVDTFSVRNGSLRIAASVETTEWLRPYVKVGINSISERLYVMYDDTTWGIDGLQSTAYAGTLVQPGDHASLALGAGLASKPATYSTEDDPKAGMLFKLTGSAAWTF